MLRAIGSRAQPLAVPSNSAGRAPQLRIAPSRHSPCSIPCSEGASTSGRIFSACRSPVPHAAGSPRRTVLASASAAPADCLQHAPPADSSAPPRARIAVFVSGGGSNFQAVHAACLDGRINADIVAVVSDVPSCGGVAYARSLGIPTLTFPAPKKATFPGLSVEELVHALTVEHTADLVLLAGFLKLVPVEVVRSFKRAILNIHPSLLPAFGGHGYYGERVHKAVIASGARFSGPTVHFVDEEFDTGPILAQRMVPVLPTDTYKQLAARVLKQEHSLYPEAVAALCDGRVTWRSDGVPILWSAH